MDNNFYRLARTETKWVETNYPCVAIRLEESGILGDNFAAHSNITLFLGTAEEVQMLIEAGITALGMLEKQGRV